MKQSSVEQLMHELGVERQKSKANKARESGTFTHTNTGKWLLANAVNKLAEELREFRSTLEDRKGPGRRNSVQPLLACFPKDMYLVALITAKTVIDGLGSSNRNLTAVAGLIGRRLQDEVMFRAVHESDRGLWEYKRRTLDWAGYVHFIRDLKGQVERNGIAYEVWPRKSSYKLGLYCIESLANSTGIIQIVRVKNRNRRRNEIRISPETLSWIESSQERHEVLFPFNLPCTIPPKSWTTPFDGGYHTKTVTRFPLVSAKGNPRIVKQLKGHDMPEVFDAVNTLQRTPWELNPDVMQVMKHYWDLGRPVADLPPREDDPVPTRPPKGSSKDIYKQWTREASRVHSLNNQHRSRRLLCAKTFFVAERFQEGRFFFPYHLDFRGRFYPTPYYLQPQGNGQARGLLRFAEGKPIENEEHSNWLAIHGANMWGEDKGTFEHRIGWVGEHEKDIKAVYADPVDNLWWTEADKPWEFLAFCMEWGAFLEEGYGFVSKIPVSVDGSNNGLQIFSLLLRDKVGAESTNVSPTDCPRDIYQDVADTTVSRLRVRSAKGELMAQQWLAFMGNEGHRKMAKRITMCVPYGLKSYSAQEYTAEWYRSHLKVNGGMTPFKGEAYPEIRYLTDRIWEALDEVVSSARRCMAWLQECAKLVAKEGHPMRWTVPSGFPVLQEYLKTKVLRVRTLIGETTRIMHISQGHKDAQLARMKQSNGIAPNFVHSLDAAAVALTVNRCREQGVVSFQMIHDSYGTTAADMSIVFRELRSVYAELFSEDQLANFKREVEAHTGVHLPPVPEFGDLDPASVRDSVYFFA